MNDDMRKRIHKIRESIYTLNVAVNEVVGGYRFGDAMGPQKLKHLDIARRCAVEELEKVANTLEAEYDQAYAAGLNK